jgi:5-methylcytosine-specific restriction protein A
MRHDARRGTARERGYDWQWQQTRKVVLAQEPVCRMCRNAVATLVDHIVPIVDGGSRLEYENLQPLCSRCHVTKTKADLKARFSRGASAV